MSWEAYFHNFVEIGQFEDNYQLLYNDFLVARNEKKVLDLKYAIYCSGSSILRLDYRKSRIKELQSVFDSKLAQFENQTKVTVNCYSDPKHNSNVSFIVFSTLIDDMHDNNQFFNIYTQQTLNEAFR